MSSLKKPDKYELTQSEAMAHFEVSRPTIILWRKQGTVKAKRLGKHWFYVREPIHVVEKRRVSRTKDARSAAGKRATKAEIILFEIEQSLEVAEEDMHWLAWEGRPNIEKGWRAAYHAPRLVSTAFRARSQVDDARLRLERARSLISPGAFEEIEKRWLAFESAMVLFEKQIVLFLRQLAIQVQETARAAFVAQLAQTPAAHGPEPSEAKRTTRSAESKEEEEK